MAWLGLWIYGTTRPEYDGVTWMAVGFAAALIALMLLWMAACIPIVRRVGLRWIAGLVVWSALAIGVTVYERAQIASCEMSGSWNCYDPSDMTWFIGSIWAYFSVPLVCAGLIVGRHRKQSGRRLRSLVKTSRSHPR